MAELARNLIIKKFHYFSELLVSDYKYEILNSNIILFNNVSEFRPSFLY